MTQRNNSNKLHLSFVLLSILNTCTNASNKVTIELEPAPAEWNEFTGHSNTFLKVTNPNATNQCYSICTDDNNIAEQRLEGDIPLENCVTVEKACGGNFELDIQSFDTIEFVLRPPPPPSSSSTNDVEMILPYPTDEKETIDIVFEANAKCNDQSNTQTQIFTSSHISASVFGSNVDTLINAYDGDGSFVMMNNGGCGIYTRLRFRPASVGGDGEMVVVMGSFSELKWSVYYDASLIVDGPVLYSYGTLGSGDDGSSSSSIAASVEVKEVIPANNDTNIDSPPSNETENKTKPEETQNLSSDEKSAAFSLLHESGSCYAKTVLLGTLCYLAFI